MPSKPSSGQTLMQTAQAFSNVQWALSWLIDNFPRFADWRAEPAGPDLGCTSSGPWPPLSVGNASAP